MTDSPDKWEADNWEIPFARRMAPHDPMPKQRFLFSDPPVSTTELHPDNFARMQRELEDLRQRVAALEKQGDGIGPSEHK